MEGDDGVACRDELVDWALEELAAAEAAGTAPWPASVLDMTKIAATGSPTMRPLWPSYSSQRIDCGGAEGWPDSQRPRSRLRGVTSMLAL